jgi:hypothetical protein
MSPTGLPHYPRARGYNQFFFFLWHYRRPSASSMSFLFLGGGGASCFSPKMGTLEELLFFFSLLHSRSRLSERCSTVLLQLLLQLLLARVAATVAAAMTCMAWRGVARSKFP